MWVIVAVTAMAVGTTVNAYGQMEAGKAQQEALERQAEEEKIAAGARELERKQQLNKVLAANNASMAASGIATEGTPASIALESSKQIGSSEAMFSLSEKLKQAQLRRQGAMAKSTGYANAASTLLQGIGSAASIGSSAKKTKET